MAELKQFQYKGHSFEELKKMDIKEFIKIVPARTRRSLKRGLTEQQKILLKTIKAARVQIEAGKDPKMIKTHCRDMVIIPLMVGLSIGVHNGRTFERVDVNPEMLGHVLGEFTYNRKRVAHHAPGVGATRGSAFVSVK